jgi:4-amino-4-deoxy-L-arabinose transferase-like glycosyltransferase
MDNAAPRRQWEPWILIAILLIATALRLVALDDVPPGPGYDELQNTHLAKRVLAGQWAIYFPENHGQEPLYPMLEALAVRLLGWSVFSIRLPGALAGVMSVLMLYMTGRRLVNRRAALLAAAFHAVSFWSLIETRMALEMTLLPPLTGLAILFLARGFDDKERSRWRTLLDFTLAGLFLGGQVYAYTAGRVLLFLPPMLLGYMLLLDRRTLSTRWPALLTLCMVALLVAAPLALFLRAHPEAEERLGHLSGPLTALRGGDFRPVLEITSGTLGMFTFQGEPQWLYNISGRPVFDPLTSLFLYIGLVLCVASLRRWRYGLILLWLFVGLGPAFVSPPPASFNHTLAAQPAIYLALAIGIDTAWERLRRLHPWAGALAGALLLALNSALSGYAYFATWADAPQVRELYQYGVTAVARELDAHAPSGPVAIGAPYVNYWHHWNVLGFELQLQRDDLSVRWFDPAGAWVWPAGEGPAVYYFPSDPLGPQAFNPAMKSSLFAELGLTPLRGDGYTFFVARSAVLEERWDALTAPTLAWPPDLAHLPKPALPLAFGDPPAGRFALLGIQMQDETVSPGDELRLTTYWEVLAADPAPVVAFVHLISDGLDVWGQHDWLDVWADGLQPGDRFTQVHVVPVEADTPPGPYHVQLGLYGPDTLERLPIIMDAEAQADRVWVTEVRITE